MYASSAQNFQHKQIGELNACWNSVIGRIFVYQRSESVKAVLCGLGRLNFKHLLLLHKVKFYKRLFLKSGFLHNVLWVSLNNESCDECMIIVFSPLSTAIANILSGFTNMLIADNSSIMFLYVFFLFLFLSLYISVCLSYISAFVGE